VEGLSVDGGGERDVAWGRVPPQFTKNYLAAVRSTAFSLLLRTNAVLRIAAK
jgi:hypothetical protein